MGEKHALEGIDPFGGRAVGTLTTDAHCTALSPVCRSEGPCDLHKTTHTAATPIQTSRAGVCLVAPLACLPSPVAGSMQAAARHVSSASYVATVAVTAVYNTRPNLCKSSQMWTGIERNEPNFGRFPGDFD